MGKVKAEMFDDTIEQPIQNDDPNPGPSSLDDLPAEEQAEYAVFSEEVDSENKIEVTPEGRDGVWVADKGSVIKFLKSYKFKDIHQMKPWGCLVIGIDMSIPSAIDMVVKAERLAILTGESLSNNMRHALSVIKDNELYMFDIGEITEDDLNITPL